MASQLMSPPLCLLKEHSLVSLGLMFDPYLPAIMNHNIWNGGDGDSDGDSDGNGKKWESGEIS